MREIVITKNDAGQRLDKFLQKSLRLPPALMYRYLRKKRIKRNGQRAAGGDVLREGDRLSLYIGDEFFEAAPRARHTGFPPPQIIYEDESVLVLNKPQGLLSHGGPEEDTLINRMLGYLESTGAYDPAAEMSFAPALCNRIDRNTGGIVIAAKNAETLRIINEKIKNHEVEKSYLCITVGRPKPVEGKIAGFLLKDEAKKQVAFYRRPIPGGKTAVTLYRTLETRGPLSLVECRLLTGRTHQIRVSMAEIGCPLLGDGKYGKLDKRFDRNYQALYSYKLTFTFTTDAGSLAYLNGKSFRVEKVDFAEQYFPDVKI